MLHLRTLLLLTLAFACPLLAAEEPKPEDGIVGKAEVYLPGDDEEPVRIYFGQFPSDISDPDFDPQERVRIFDQIREAAARADEEAHPKRLRKANLKKLIGISMEDLEWERRTDKLKAIAGTEHESLVNLQPTPLDRLDAAKSFIEFGVRDDEYDPVVQRNLARLRAALIDGKDEIYYEKLTFSEKLRSIRQFSKDIAALPQDPEHRARAKKVLGVHVEKQDFYDGVFYAVYRNVVSATVWLNKGLEPATALSLAFIQSTLTFAQNVYGRQYSALFNFNPSFPGYRSKSSFVKRRRDLYYLLTNEMIQGIAAEGSMGTFLSAQRAIIFQNRIMGKVDHAWGSGPRDRVLGDNPRAFRMFNRLSFALTTPLTTMEIAQLMSGSVFDIRIGDLLLYKVTTNTIGTIGAYYGLNRLLKYKPEIFTELADGKWMKAKLQKLGSIKNWVWNRCRALVGREPKIEAYPEKSPPGPKKLNSGT